MLGESAPFNDVYTEYSAPPPSSGAPAASLGPRDRDPLPLSRGRSRSKSPDRRSPPPRSSYRGKSPIGRPKHAPTNPTPSNVLGVFGLSIRTTERDLDTEFSKFGVVDKVTIVYDQRSDRSRGFGFIKLATTEDATRCIQEMNGVELNGRRIRVDYSVTERPHAPTPGEYMGHRRSNVRDRDRHGEPYRDSYRDRDYKRDDSDRHERPRYDRDRYADRYSERDRDRDPYGREGGRDWRRRTPPPPAPRRGFSPASRPRRRSYSRSPPLAPRGASPPRSSMRDYDLPPPAASGLNGDSRW